MSTALSKKIRSNFREGISLAYGKNMGSYLLRNSTTDTTEKHDRENDINVSIAQLEAETEISRNSIRSWLYFGKYKFEHYCYMLSARELPSDIFLSPDKVMQQTEALIYAISKLRTNKIEKLFQLKSRGSGTLKKSPLYLSQADWLLLATLSSNQELAGRLKYKRLSIKDRDRLIPILTSAQKQIFGKLQIHPEFLNKEYQTWASLEYCQKLFKTWDHHWLKCWTVLSQANMLDELAFKDLWSISAPLKDIHSPTLFKPRSKMNWIDKQVTNIPRKYQWLPKSCPICAQRYSWDINYCMQCDYDLTVKSVVNRFNSKVTDRLANSITAEAEQIYNSLKHRYRVSAAPQSDKAQNQIIKLENNIFPMEDDQYGPWMKKICQQLPDSLYVLRKNRKIIGWINVFFLKNRALDEDKLFVEAIEQGIIPEPKDLLVSPSLLTGKQRLANQVIDMYIDAFGIHGRESGADFKNAVMALLCGLSTHINKSTTFEGTQLRKVATLTVNSSKHHKLHTRIVGTQNIDCYAGDRYSFFGLLSPQKVNYEKIDQQNNSNNQEYLRRLEMSVDFSRTGYALPTLRDYVAMMATGILDSELRTMTPADAAREFARIVEKKQTR